MVRYKEIDNPKELLDLVNSYDEIIGKIERSEILSLEQSGKGYARGIMVFVMNNNNKLWIPVRVLTKKIAPGGFDSSAAEHVGAGEDYLDAAIRGMSEELNIIAKPNSLVYIGKTFPKKNLPYFHKVYVYYSEEVNDYSKNDFASYDWMSVNQLEHTINSGHPAKDTISDAIPLISNYLNERDDHESH